MSTSIPRPPPLPKPSPADWENVKDEIEDLYVVQEQKLSYVADTLRLRHGFIATQRMFKSRIKEWGFDQKTIREADWRFMFQEYHRRRNLSTPKDTIFAIREDRPGRVSKPKNLKHIRNYIRRKRVSEEAFLSGPSDRNNFPHIRALTPPLSPEPSSGSASPSSQGHDNANDEPSPFSSLEVPEPSYTRYSPFGWPNTSLIQAATTSRTVAHRAGIEPHQDLRAAQLVARPSDRPRAAIDIPWRTSQASPASHDSSGTSTISLARGLECMARQTLAPDRYRPSEESLLYRLSRAIAGPPSPADSTMSQTNDEPSDEEIVRANMELGYGENIESTRSISNSTDPHLSSRSYDVDPDEFLAFRWATRYFLACIQKNRMHNIDAEDSMKQATILFKQMLGAEIRSPCLNNRLSDPPSQRSRFILSGLSLMSTVLDAHGRHDTLEQFLLDSRRTISEFFGMDDHPLSIPYSYLLVLTKKEAMDDDYWETHLKRAHENIRHAWGNEGPNALVSQYYLAWHILKRKRFGQAIQQLTECLEKAERLFGKNHIITVNCLATIARAFSEQSKYDVAITWQCAAIDRAQNALISVEHPFRFKLIERLGDLYKQTGHLDLAESKYRDVVDGRKYSLGLSHGYTSYAISKVEEIMAQQGKRIEAARFVRDLDNEHTKQLYEHWDTHGQYPTEQHILDEHKLSKLY